MAPTGSKAGTEVDTISSEDVAVVDGTELVSPPQPPFPTLREVERWLTEPGYVIPWPEDTAAHDIARQVLEADDPLFDMSDLPEGLKVEQNVGLNFQLNSVGFRPSDEKSGAAKGGAFAILSGVTMDGEQVTLITGSQRILAAALAMVKKNRLGQWVKVASDKSQGRGRDFYFLVHGDEPFPTA